MRDARLAFRRFHEEEPTWKIDSIRRDTYRKNSFLATQPPRTFEDTVQVNLYCGPETTMDRDNADVLVRAALEDVGPVHSVWEKRFSDTPYRLKCHQYYARFFNNQHAMNAAKSLSASRTTVCFIPSLYSDCFRSKELNHVFQDFVVEVVPWSADVDDEVRHWTSNKASVPAKSRVPKDSYVSPGRTGQEEVAPRSGRGCEIDDARIVAGLETRTTVSFCFLISPWMTDI